MPSIFSQIILGQIPCHKVAEDDGHIAFMDISPVTKGHVLVVPKIEVDRLFELDDDSYVALMLFTKKVAASIKKSFDCDRVGMSVVGLEVPHAHVHLMPISSLSDMDLTRAKLHLKSDELAKMAKIIQGNLI